LSGCAPIIPICPRPEPSLAYSQVTFLQNTLDYPVLAQSYFYKFNNSTNFCQDKPIAWSEPILIQPNEYQIIMDYVKPVRIKLFNTDTLLIVDIQYGWQGNTDEGKVLKFNGQKAVELDANAKIQLNS
jgi:hypothetical protein